VPTGYESGKTWSPIGAQATVSTSAASRVWTLNEVAAYEGASSWPAPFTSQYEYIAGHTFDGSTSSYEFTSIPQTYNSLRIVATELGQSSSIASPRIQLNGDTYAGYGFAWTGSHGGSITSRFGGQTSQTSIGTYDTNEASTPSAREILLDGYTLSNMVSPVQYQFATCATSGTSNMSANSAAAVLLNGTPAITSLKYYDLTGYTFASGSTITLFGFKDA
jgi:hypothetical protein